MKDNIDKSDCNIIHHEVVDSVQKKMLDDDVYMEVADMFKVFSDSTRVKIIAALSHSEMCVCDISVLLGMTKSAISHQLRGLKQAKIIKFRKEGRVVYYSLADEHITAIFTQGLHHAINC